MNRLLIVFVLVLWQLAASRSSVIAESAPKDQLDRGAQLYASYCAICHQPGGRGVAPTFPPIYKSDYLAADKERSIRILITGLTGAVKVGGQIFDNIMPPAPYDDQQLADVLTYVNNNFGNSNGIVTAEEVKQIRAKAVHGETINPDPNPYAPLPAAPRGFTLREVVRLPSNPTRMAGDGQGHALYVLSENGDVWRVELPSGTLQRVLQGSDYATVTGGFANCVGLMLDAQNRLYIVANHRLDSHPFVTNEVTIYRTAPLRAGEDPTPKPWLRTNYPWGVSSFNHGVNNIATGPDGYIYVSSGSRTDGNETGNDTNYFPGGEVPLTACMWRLDPRAEKPEIEIFARGLRNSYGFCWNDRGEMFATENGPDANAAEELNQLEHGKHYGFPYTFSNWTKKAYPYTPDSPPGITFTPPIGNFGPDAGGSPDKPLYTFDPHSSPGGIVFLGDNFPPDYRGTFLVTRFGNLIATKPKDVGFDLLQVRLQKNASGVYEAKVKTLISPLARPVDIHISGGKIYICEYTRVLDNSGKLAMLPGRILELAVKP